MQLMGCLPSHPVNTPDRGYADQLLSTTVFSWPFHQLSGETAFFCVGTDNGTAHPHCKTYPTAGLLITRRLMFILNSINGSGGLVRALAATKMPLLWSEILL